MTALKRGIFFTLVLTRNLISKSCVKRAICAAFCCKWDKSEKGLVIAYTF